MSRRYAIDPIKLRKYPATEVFKLYYELEDFIQRENKDNTIQGIGEQLKAGEERTINRDGKTQVIRRLN